MELEPRRDRPGDDRCGTAGSRRCSRTRTTTLPVSVDASTLPSPVITATHASTAARTRSRRDHVEAVHDRAPIAARPPASPPAPPEPGSATSMPRRVERLARPRAAPRAPRHRRATRLLWAEHGRCVEEGRRHVAGDLDLDAAQRPTERVEAPRPPSVVAEPPTPTITRRQPWSIAAAMSSPVPRSSRSGSLRATRARPIARAISTIRLRRRAPPRKHRRGCRPVSSPVAAYTCPPEPRIASRVPSPRQRAATGLACPPVPRPAHRRRRLGRGQAPAELVGAAEHRTRLHPPAPAAEDVVDRSSRPWGMST